mgnify:CR=1 FL=1
MTDNENEVDTKVVKILNRPHASIRDLTARIDKETDDLSARLYRLNKALRELVIATEDVEGMIGKIQDNSDEVMDIVSDLSFEIRQRRIF